MIARPVDLAAVRKRAWETRREKYGPRGHRGTYSRSVERASIHGMLALIIRLHNEGTLTEGQVARATGLDRISIRDLADAAIRSGCVSGRCWSPIACSSFGYCRETNKHRGEPPDGSAA